MARFNPDFWEIPAGSEYLEGLPADRGLWYSTEVDQERRYAFDDFFQSVKPAVYDLIERKLTGRQKEVVKLYYLYGKTQEDIATILDLTQSTVSRHLFGTVRGGKKVGGAIPKLQKLIERDDTNTIAPALDELREKLAVAV